ncbi:MAG TPA: hypothetical protein VLB29_05975 [Nocardioidaceae bacterium]|nr:hypothetical protein [Nocardioidaceae bacterium]
MTAETFDRLFLEGSRAVLAREHTVDAPPTLPGERWGPSVCLRPDPVTAGALDALTRQALEYVGPGHWPTGASRSSHFTVRVLDGYREDLTPDAAATGPHLAAMREAAGSAGPLRLRLTGLTLTPASVMAAAEPEGSGATTFAAAVADALGEHGWFEAGSHRSIWYANLVHFTGPIAHPAALVDWVAQRRRLDLGVAAVEPELLDWVFAQGQMVPVVLGRLA